MNGMKRWVKVLVWISLISCITLAAGACWFLSIINPQQHFANIQHPILVPATEPDEELKPDTPPTITRGDEGDYSPSAAQEAQEEQSEKRHNATFNILLLGIDGSKREHTRTDLIMLAHVNLTQQTLTLISIPRDTQVNIEGLGLTKINHAHFLGNLKGGSEDGTISSIRAVQQLLSLEVNYYVKVDFNSFKHFIDLIDGIEINSPRQVGEFPKGLQTLNGEETLRFVRERHSLAQGDRDRQANHALVLQALAKKLLHPKEIFKLGSLYGQLKEMVETNFSEVDILNLAYLYKGIDDSQITYLQIPGQNGRAFDPLVDKELYFWIPDIEKVKDMLREREIY